MPTLEWIGKEKVVNHHQQVPYRVLEAQYTHNAERSENMIIRGDNLEALKSLLPKYEGKVVYFRALIGRDPRLGDTSFLAGRQLMTCCADDIAYNAFITNADAPITLPHGAWAWVKVEIHIQKHQLYRNPGPILTLLELEQTDAPEQPVATFY